MSESVEEIDERAEAPEAESAEPREADASGPEPAEQPEPTDSADPNAPERDAPALGEPELAQLTAIVESLLFLSQDPVKVKDLAEATDTEPADIDEALARLQQREGGLVLRQIGGGWTLASIPEAEKPARRLLAKPRTPPLTQAQAECLSIVAYLQPVSRPEIARIRGVASESAVATLEERGLIEDCGRSQFGAILYRTSALFQRLFGLASIDALPDPTAFDPSPEEEGELRDRLLRAGEIRAGGPAAQQALPVDGAPVDAEPVDADGDADLDAEPVDAHGDAELDAEPVGAPRAPEPDGAEGEPAA